MILLSLQKLAGGFITVWKRFPLEMLVAITGTVSAILLIEREYEGETNLLNRLTSCSALGIALILSGSLFSESHKFTGSYRILIKVITIALLLVLFLFLGPIDQDINALRFAFLLVAFHLLVSFAPFMARGSVNGFWEYNLRLFLRILQSGLYSGVLFIGLALAVGSTNALFDLEMTGKIYGYLFCLVAGIFNTAFFLTGVPEDWENLETNQTYPKSLKIFTQFVLIPLATVYLAILLAYEFKVIAEWSLPKGLVASLVLGYSVYGMLSILLVYPIRLDEGNKWIRTYARWFYLLLIPLLILFALAVWQRVNQYGITESRYILIVLCVWLTGITVYFLSSRIQNIRYIPLTLCLMALLAVAGPQSATSVSKRSQLKRLVQFFESRGAWVNSKFIPLEDASHTHEGAELVQFIVSRYGVETLQDYLSVSADSLVQAADTSKNAGLVDYDRSLILSHYLGLRFDYEGGDGKQINAVYAVKEAIDIADYARMIKAGGSETSVLYRFGPTFIELELNSVVYVYDLSALMQAIAEDPTSTYWPQARLRIADEKNQSLLVLTHFRFARENEVFTIDSFDGYLLLR
jgi:hypothetical protein